MSQPEPGACGDPGCYVLHADPNNPIHPPDYVAPENAALTVRESPVRKCEHGYDHAHPFKDPGEPFRDCPGPASGCDVCGCAVLASCQHWDCPLCWPRTRRLADA